jgi:hypothetical protein
MGNPVFASLLFGTSEFAFTFNPVTHNLLLYSWHIFSLQERSAFIWKANLADKCFSLLVPPALLGTLEYFFATLALQFGNPSGFPHILFITEHTWKGNAASKKESWSYWISFCNYSWKPNTDRYINSFCNFRNNFFSKSWKA